MSSLKSEVYFMYDKKIFISLYLFFITCSYLQAQDLPSYSYKGLVIYAEVGGATRDYSINAEHAFAQVGKFKLNARVGFGIANFKKFKSDAVRNFIGIPIGVQAFNYIGSNSHTELGIGLSYIRGGNPNEYPALEPVNSKTLVFMPNIGYRFQKPNGGFFIRLLYTPGIAIKEFSSIPISSKKYFHGVGLSIGYYINRE